MAGSASLWRHSLPVPRSIKDRRVLANEDKWRQTDRSNRCCFLNLLDMSRSETTFHESSQPEDNLLPTPDGGYGWVIVGSCFILNGLTWGVTAVSVLNSLTLQSLINVLVLWRLSNRVRLFEKDRKC